MGEWGWQIKKCFEYSAKVEKHCISYRDESFQSTPQNPSTGLPGLVFALLDYVAWCSF